MLYRISMDVAIGAIRSAFDPFVCVVRVYDYEKRLRFHILDHDGKPLESAVGIPMRYIVEPARLRAEIQEARARLEKKGFTLSAWTPP